MSHVKEVLRYVRAPVDFEDVLLNGSDSIDDIVQQSYLAVVRNGVALKGNFETSFTSMESFSPNVQLRLLKFFIRLMYMKIINNIT